MTEDQKKYKPRPGGLTGVWPEVSKKGMKYYSGTCTREDLLVAMECGDAQRDGDQLDDDKFKVLVWINDKKHDRTKWLTLPNANDKTGDVHLSKLTNANTETVEPIPNNNQSTNHNTNIVYPWDSELFKKTWDIWKQYKKEQFNFKYANKYTEQAQLKKLTNLAQNEEHKAIELIEYAIAEGWKGFYPIRNKATTSTGFDAEKYRAHLESL